MIKKYNKPNALNEVFQSRVKRVDTNDYLALATLYLQVFNAAKATPDRIEAMLAKYKVSIFGRLNTRTPTASYVFAHFGPLAYGLHD